MRDSNPLGQLGRLEHNPYANPAKIPLAMNTAEPSRRSRALANTSAGRSFDVHRKWSGQPGSNRRPTPWQGVVLPTELCPPPPAPTRPAEDHIPELLRSIRPRRRGRGSHRCQLHLVRCPGIEPGQPRHRFYRPLRVLSAIPPQYS